MLFVAKGVCVKKLFLLGLLTISPLIAMDPRGFKSGWNTHAQAYKNNNWVQAQAADRLLQEFGIDLSGKLILDVGCGLGNITTKMAQTALGIVGIDSSKEMIDAAVVAYSGIKNVLFLEWSAEALDLEEECDLITSFFCLHWVKDKLSVFTNFYRALKPGGTIFCTLAVGYATSVMMEFFAKVVAQLVEKHPFLQDKDISEIAGRFSIAQRDLERLLEQCGFVLTVIEQKKIETIFENRERFAAFQRPIFMSAPIIGLLSIDEAEAWFGQFINEMWQKLEKNTDGSVKYCHGTAVLSAQRPGEITMRTEEEVLKYL